MITLAGVSKSFQGATALADIELVVTAGQTVCLVGESGSGKSTLLKALIGLVVPDRGRISVLGRSPAARDWPQLRRRIGYVLQDGGLFPHMSAAANACLAARAFGWPTQQQRERLLELAALTRLPKSLLDRFPSELSGGQRQRVALIRALMLDPDLLLLDEPLGALDPIIRSELQDELKAWFAALGKTVVFVTHDLAEAAHLSADLVVLHRGRIQQRGSIFELKQQPANDYVYRLVNAVRGLPEALA